MLYGTDMTQSTVEGKRYTGHECPALGKKAEASHQNQPIKPSCLGEQICPSIEEVTPKIRKRSHGAKECF